MHTGVLRNRQVTVHMKLIGDELISHNWYSYSANFVRNRANILHIYSYLFSFRYMGSGG